MIPEPFTAGVMILKGIGSICGATLALLVKPARTPGEFFVRLIASILCGVIGATPFRETLKWPPTEDYVVVSAAIVAFAAWWASKAAIRGLEKLDIPWPWVKK